MENTQLEAKVCFWESTFHMLKTGTANPFSYRSGHCIASIEDLTTESCPSNPVTFGDPSQKTQNLWCLAPVFSHPSGSFGSELICGQKVETELYRNGNATLNTVYQLRSRYSFVLAVTAAYWRGLGKTLCPSLPLP